MKTKEFYLQIIIILQRVYAILTSYFLDAILSICSISVTFWHFFKLCDKDKLK